MFTPELPPDRLLVHTKERDINYWKQRLIEEEDEAVKLHERIERLEEVLQRMLQVLQKEVQDGKNCSNPM